MLAWLAGHGCEVKDLRKPTLGAALRRKGLDPIVRRVDRASPGCRPCRGCQDRLVARLARCQRWSSPRHAALPWRRHRTMDRARTTATEFPARQRWRRGENNRGFDRRSAACRRTLPAARGHRRSRPRHDMRGARAPTVDGDFSGIESRVLAWVSGQQSKLEQWAKFDRTGDPKDEPYYIIGRQCGQPEETARTIGKTADLAFGSKAICWPAARPPKPGRTASP